MRWLWQYGSKWLVSRLWQQARKPSPAGSNEDEPDIGQGSPPVAKECVLAIVCPTKRLFDAIADALSWKKQIAADRFSLCIGGLGIGGLAGRQVLVAWPTVESPDLVRLITALVEAHRPRLVLSASEAESLHESVKPGELVVANRVLDAAGHGLRLDGTLPARPGIHCGGIASKTQEQRTAIVDESSAPLVCDDWSWPVARACQQIGVPLVAVGLVLEPDASHRSKEVAAYKKQSSLAGRAGSLAGMAWKKRSGLRDLWKRQEAGWEASSRFVRLAKELAEAVGGEAET